MKPTTFPTADPAVALYGGSFDPVHAGHLQVAQSAVQQLDLDKVVFIPAAQSPLKSVGAVASAADRLEMLHLATRSDARFEVDSCEIKRGGTSYTVDTLEFFRRTHPQWRLHWIIGADQFELLPRWHRIEAIAAQVKFIVLRRPGYSIEPPPVAGLDYVEVAAPFMPHSSSEIRRKLAAGSLAADWLPPAVEAFISSRGLYTR